MDSDIGALEGASEDMPTVGNIFEPGRDNL